MLRKILRYDSMALKHNIPLLMGVSLPLSAFAMGLFVLINCFHLIEKPMVFSFILGIYIISIIAIVALAAISMIFVIYRYFQSLFSDEGYLTMIIPAKVGTIFDGKIIGGLIWISGIAVVAAVDLFIAVMLPDFISGGGEISDIIVEIVPEVAPALPLLILLNGIVTALSYVLVIYSAITVGAILMPKKKVLGAFLFIFLFDFGFDIMQSVVLIAMVFTTERPILYQVIQLIIRLAICVPIYILPRKMLETKYNLE